MKASLHEIHGVGRQPNRHPLVEELLLEAVLASVESASGRLLDVGCGAKPYGPLFSPCVESYVGIDLNPTPCSRDALDICADAASLPFPADSFHTVLCTEVLEHVPEPKLVIDEFERVLKPDGRIIMTCCQTFQLHEQPRDYYRYTRFGLEYLLSRSRDLETELLAPVGGTLDFAVYLASAMVLGLVPRFLGKHITRKIVCTLQASYLQVRGGRPGSEAFCFGHLAIARKVAPRRPLGADHEDRNRSGQGVPAR
jgi:SAM-dependent methyltransferase